MLCLLKDKTDMPTAPKVLLDDDLILGLWAAIALLGASHRRPDRANKTELVAKAERILSALIQHLADRTLLRPSARMPGTAP